MKCFVHLDLELMPREFDNPDEAIEFVEKNLTDESMSIRWRRDDSYPDNYFQYQREELLEEIDKTGEVTLQLIGSAGDDLVIGAIATIVTEELENKENAEAEAELDKIGKELADGYKTAISIRAFGETKTFKPSKDGSMKRHRRRKK